MSESGRFAGGLWPNKGRPGGGRTRARVRISGSGAEARGGRRRRGNDSRRHLRRAAPGQARGPRPFEDGLTAWEALQHDAAGPRDSRHRPAAHGWPGAVPPAARAVRAPADHLRDVAGRRVRPRARPRDRRRRLPVQTVLDARADGARQGAAAARGLRRERPRARKTSWSSSATCAWIRSGCRSRGRGHGRAADRHRVPARPGARPASRRRADPRPVDGRPPIRTARRSAIAPSTAT